MVVVEENFSIFSTCFAIDECSLLDAMFVMGKVWDN
jgi:hypothetical protein